MIESYYWKEKIRKAASVLEKKRGQRRWRSRSIDFFERELMIAFFCVRKLIEAKKLTDKCDALKVTAFRYPNIGKPLDLMSLIEFETIYDLPQGGVSSSVSALSRTSSFTPSLSSPAFQ